MNFETKKEVLEYKISMLKNEMNVLQDRMNTLNSILEESRAALADYVDCAVASVKE